MLTKTSPRGPTWIAPSSPISVKERAGGMKCVRESSKFDSVVGVQDGPFADLQADTTTRIALSPEPVTSGCRTNQI
ncbi:hypothetical protein TNCT_127101 [Trichonephila clavata]|uniref:Uncharacterized protein n=1 Tax=Trichonephila clavata TaxID=2740835 RepID=A0A8X6FQX8_TRICU|nr:hypothetical protein TNCT_127101 [Trichonephila clavata]